MHKSLLFAPLAALAASAAFVVAPAFADGHMEAAAPTLDEVLAHSRRDDDRARDQYRHPKETLEFFGIKPTMTVVEINPGGGWYTRVLAPYLMAQGKYVAVSQDSDNVTGDRARRARAMGAVERFKSAFATAYGVEEGEVNAFEIDEVPEEMIGTVDMILAVRTLHGSWNGGTLLGELQQHRRLLKDGGLVGIVQHRAPSDASYADVNPAQGYMREADVIKLMELAGFELVKKSEINANPKDPANWEGGVWTLPPTLRYGDQDRAKYEAIGESDRMTLLFKKAD